MLNEEMLPIADTITMIANGQAGEATGLVHDLLGARVLDALQGHKQEIAKTLFAPGADTLAEETEELDEAKTKKKAPSDIPPFVPDKKWIAYAQKRENADWAKSRKAAGLKEESEQLDEKNWIAGAIKHPGALHRALHVPQGEKIPAGKLEAAAHKKGKVGKEARLAKTLKGLHK